jgi:hypothetical protein
MFDQIMVPLKGSLNLEDVQQQERSLQPSAVDSAAPTAELHLHCPFFRLNRLVIYPLAFNGQVVNTNNLQTAS